MCTSVEKSNPTDTLSVFTGGDSGLALARTNSNQVHPGAPDASVDVQLSAGQTLDQMFRSCCQLMAGRLRVRPQTRCGGTRSEPRAPGGHELNEQHERSELDELDEFNEFDEQHEFNECLEFDERVQLDERFELNERVQLDERNNCPEWLEGDDRAHPPQRR